ncbi:RNA methyltransferase [uncultured Christiangramia sp.]|mgnify:FL=1|uniref:TrmH family RNA methyltransferase n=1 Tax=uncultured Christiangramia sp. TaxID=503836 RepID=UPI0025F133F8|nr:RNA methyltransferase [uncultured Christiangramia sp.]
MVSKSQIKLIKSLSQKKHRLREKLFIVEGIKGVKEFLRSDFELYALFGSCNLEEVNELDFFEANSTDLARISSLTTAPDYLAVFRMREDLPIAENGLKVVLDGVRDPGNLGTIIRLCDWFGITDLICSRDTVDCFNSKVVQASMGSLSRVNIVYTDLHEFISKKQSFPIYGTLLEGADIYQSALDSESFVIFGNEANGISSEIQKLVKQKISIPQYGKEQNTESLNVATATAITLAEFRRQESIGK